MYNNLLLIFKNAESRILKVDKRGAFSSDDEVGFVFRIIKDTINSIVERLQKINEEKN